MTRIVKFLKKNKTLTHIVLVNVVTYTLLNTLIDEIVVPILEFILPECELKKFNIVLKRATLEEDEIVIRTSKVIKKFVLWVMIIFLITSMINVEDLEKTTT